MALILRRDEGGGEEGSSRHAGTLGWLLEIQYKYGVFGKHTPKHPAGARCTVVIYSECAISRGRKTS